MQIKLSALFLTLLFVFAAGTNGQERCLTEGEAKRAIATVSSPALVSENKRLRKELLEMRKQQENIGRRITDDVEKNKKYIPEANQMGLKHLLRVCEIIRENGWPTRTALRDDGYEAFTFLILNNKAYRLQQQLIPVLVEAARQGAVRNSFIASLVDGIRVGSGLPQIFGTQATIRDDVIYLYPLLNEERVDEFRKMYDLPPLAVEIRAMEDRYLLPLLKMQRSSRPPAAGGEAAEEGFGTAALGISDDEDEVLTIESRLVNLNVRLIAPDQRAPVDLNLTKDDFIVLEDGVEQEILFFTTTEQPFDLVLLLDFSGSTLEKRGLIKKAAERFVERARPSDRIAVVAFTDEIHVVSNPTTDKKALVGKIRDIDIEGGSAIWDALKFAYENIIQKESAGRRSAIVFMTDGEDGSRETTFADVMETVRRGETTIFSVYLDTGSYHEKWREKYRQKSRQTLLMLAEESGGQFYRADDVKDLNGVYEQVINDLGKVYSIAYEPKNEARDGGWRTLTVKVKTRPDLVVRTRRGYYAR